MDGLLQILASASISTVLAGILLWISRLWLSERLKASIKAEYDQKLETHKAQLQAQSSVELEKLRAALKAEADVQTEKLRSELNAASHEHNVKFSHLHEMRAVTLTETYALLRNLHDRMADYVAIFEFAGGPSREDCRKAVVEAYPAFCNYYLNRAILLPKATANRLDAINKDIRDTFHEFAIMVDQPNPEPDHHQIWNAVHKKVQNEIGTALTGIADDFRNLLGEKG